MKIEKLEIRALQGVGERLRRHLSDDGGHGEPVALGLVSRSSPANAVILRGFVPVHRDELAASGHGSAWSYRQTMKVVAEAAKQGAGVFILHRHLGRGAPRLSTVDERSLREMLGLQDHLYPEMLLGSVVFSEDWQAWGRARFRGVAFEINRARWLGPSIEKLPKPPPVVRERAKRHDVLWGAEGTGKLRGATVGVLGVGGGGSHVLQQLAHAGVGRLIGVDDDVLEETNRSRVVGTRPSDIGKDKLLAMKRLVRDAGDDAIFMPVRERFPSAAAIRLLASCDVLVSCLDTLHARKDVMEFAWQHAIPLVDIGLTIAPSKPGPGVAAIGGQVFVGMPGGSCMWCEGLLSTQRLELEKGNDGYVRGGGAAQVVSLNGVLASQAVTEVLNLLTGFLGEKAVSPRFVYDGREVFRPSAAAQSRPCPICATVGFGDVAWS